MMNVLYDFSVIQPSPVSNIKLAGRGCCIGMGKNSGGKIHRFLHHVGSHAIAAAAAVAAADALVRSFVTY